MTKSLFVQKLSTKITDAMVGFAFKVYIGNKFILVKVSTVDFEKTKGTFRCN